MRSSVSQWTLITTRTRIPDLSILSQALYPLSYNEFSGEQNYRVNYPAVGKPNNDVCDGRTHYYEPNESHSHT